jgi:hypothetical protein
MTLFRMCGWPVRLQDRRVAWRGSVAGTAMRTRVLVDAVPRLAETLARAGKPVGRHTEAPRASPCHRPAKESLMSKTMPDSAPAAVSAAA